MDTINTRLKEQLMDKQRLTSYKIAKRLELYVSTVDSWLVGRIKNKKRVFTTPSAVNVADICKEFNLDLVYIITGENSNNLHSKIVTGVKSEKKEKGKVFGDAELKDKLLTLYEEKIASLTKELHECQKQR